METMTTWMWFVAGSMGFAAFVVMIAIVALMMYDLIRDIGEDR